MKNNPQNLFKSSPIPQKKQGVGNPGWIFGKAFYSVS